MASINKLRKLLILVGVMTMGHHCCAGNSAWRALRVKINDKYGFDAREVASPVAYAPQVPVIPVPQFPESPYKLPNWPLYSPPPQVLLEGVPSPYSSIPVEHTKYSGKPLSNSDMSAVYPNHS